MRRDEIAPLDRQRLGVLGDRIGRLLRCRGVRPGLRVVRPAVLDQLGYGPAREGSDGRNVWFVQDAGDGSVTYAVVAGWRDRRGTTAVLSTGGRLWATLNRRIS